MKIILRQLLRRSPLIAGLSAVIVLNSTPSGQAQPALPLANTSSQASELPNDLQLILPAALPADAVYFSLRHWKHCPPAPFNWCAGLNAVSYYFSPSLGVNRIFIDDSALGTSAQSMSTPMDDSGPRLLREAAAAAQAGPAAGPAAEASPKAISPVTCGCRSFWTPTR